MSAVQPREADAGRRGLIVDSGLKAGMSILVQSARGWWPMVGIH